MLYKAAVQLAQAASFLSQPCEPRFQMKVAIPMQFTASTVSLFN